MARRDKNTYKPFHWIPGQGPDTKALKRMRQQAGRPKKAMGEDWFLCSEDERVVYNSLLDKGVADHSLEELEEILMSIASGLKCFGHADNWEDWCAYILPELIPRAFEYRSDYLIEYLVTAIMVVMPDASKPVYYGSFKEDALATLGQAIMAPERWPHGPESAWCLHDHWEAPTGYPVWGNASGDLSASIFFCLKYLATDDVRGWVKSVFDIPCPRWRGQILVWLCGTKYLIDGKISQPSELDMDNDLYRSTQWSNGYTIDGSIVSYSEKYPKSPQPIPFLSRDNRQAFDNCVQELLSEDLLARWLESMKPFPHLIKHITETNVPDELRQNFNL